MLTSSLPQSTAISRGTFSGRKLPLKSHTALVLPCQAGRGYYRTGRFSDDVSPYLDLVADVLAGVESAYTASQQARESSPYSYRKGSGKGDRSDSPSDYTDTTAENSESTRDADESSREASANPRDISWKPDAVMQAVPVDIEEHADSYTLYMDVPGLQKSDVKVQIFPSQRKMTISGERNRSTQEEIDPAGRQYRRRFERSMGKFSRTLNLAKDLDVKSVIARVDHGVLTVTAKKLAPQEPEAMEINID